MTDKKPSKKSAPRTKKSPAAKSKKTKQASKTDPIRSGIDKMVNDLVAAGLATRLSKKEWAAIRDNCDAQGCILIPKGTAARETSADPQN